MPASQQRARGGTGSRPRRPRGWARRAAGAAVHPGPEVGPGRAAAPCGGVAGRSGGPGCGVPAPPGAAGLGLAGRRRRAGGQRRGRHRLASHHHAGVRAVPVRGRLRRGPARGADRPAHAHRRTGRAWTRRSGCAQGLVSNTGMWVQGQPGIGKSTIVKRLLTGLVAFGFTAVVPGDSKGEYSALVSHLGGRVWRIGRGLHCAQPARRRTAARRARPDRRHRPRPAAGDHPRPPAVAARGPGGDRAPRGDHRDRAAAARRRPRPGGRRRPRPASRTIPDVVRVLTNPPARAAVDRRLRRPPPSSAATPATCSTPWGCCAPARSAACSTAPSSITADLDTPALSLDISALDDDEDERGGRGHAVVVGLGRRGHRRLGRPRPAPQRAAGAGRAVAGAAGGARAGGALGPGHPPGPAPRRGVGPGHPLPRRPRGAAHRGRPGQGPRHGRPQRRSWCSAGWPTTNSTASVASPR